MNKTRKLVLMAIAVAAAFIFCMMSVNTAPRQLDADETAWIANAHYFELFMAGDFDSAKWHEFEKYGQHPPVGSYLFGALTRAIGYPVKTMEPRRFWYEKDMLLFLDPGKFYAEMGKRVNYEQVLAGRYMSMFFGWVTAVLTMILAYRLCGAFGGVTALFLMVLHSRFIIVATLCAGDTFIMALAVGVVLASIEMGRRGSKLRWPVFLGVLLGLAVETKISLFSLVPVVFVVSVLSAVHCEELQGEVVSPHVPRVKRAIVGSITAVVVAALVAYAIDPGMWGGPISETILRFATRAERVDIQRNVFVFDRLDTLWERLRFIACVYFFKSSEGLALLGLTVAGLFALLFSKKMLMKRIIVLFLTAYFFALTVLMAPLSWLRYIIAFMPFLILPAAYGAGAFIRYAATVSCMDWKRTAVIFTTGYLLISSTLMAANYAKKSTFCLWRYLPNQEDGVGASMLASYLFGDLPEEFKPKLLELFEKKGERRIVDMIRAGTFEQKRDNN